jgi:uncharacterized protein YcaQ
VPASVDSLSIREARRASLHAQGMLGPRMRGGPARLVEHLRAVQLDTISVLARSHELVAFARLGAVPRASIERAFWGPRSETFEYWSHAACVLPLDSWPSYAASRRRRRARGRRWHQLEDMVTSCANVTDRLRAEGPLTARQLGGAKSGGSWWEWSEVKIAAEWLLDTGEVVCRQRRGFERVYDLAERAIPAALLEEEPDDATCARRLVESAARALGVATVADIAAYHGMLVATVRSAIADAGLVPVRVEGWAAPAFAFPGALEALGTVQRGRTTVLSPFDSLIWDRARVERLFGMRLRLEAYVPSHKRIVGYFAMPVLAADRIVGLVDPKRDGATLHARHVVLETPDAPRHTARALVTAAAWVGCDTVVVDRVTPGERLAEVRAAVRDAAR